MSGDPLGPADNGRVVRVTPGQRVEAALPQHGGTGYRWVLDPLPPGVVLVGEHTDPGGSGAAGAVGRRTFTFAVGSPDVPVRVTARLRRDWESPDAAVDLFSVELETRR
jgi:predicted secreted protein